MVDHIVQIVASYTIWKAERTKKGITPRQGNSPAQSPKRVAHLMENIYSSKRAYRQASKKKKFILTYTKLILPKGEERSKNTNETHPRDCANCKNRLARSSFEHYARVLTEALVSRFIAIIGRVLFHIVHAGVY